MSQVPLVIHVPHASTCIPDDALGDFAIGRDRLATHVGLITDHFTDELFQTANAVMVRHEVSRLVVDPERFERDEDEPMAARGQGVLYERGPTGETIRPRLSASRREWLLERWYRPHHRRLTQCVDEALCQHGRVLIVDAHSFPCHPLPLDIDQSTPRPDACIGTAGMHTPPSLVAAAKTWCESRGWSLGIDWPYAGTIVPLKHYQRVPAVMSIMVEINRDRYMHLRDNVAEQTAGCADTKAFVCGLIESFRSAIDQA